MLALHPKVETIRYNPERAGFEALVTIALPGETLRYPAFVPAPLTAEYGFITRHLAERALRAHRAARPALRSRSIATRCPAAGFAA